MARHATTWKFVGWFEDLVEAAFAPPPPTAFMPPPAAQRPAGWLLNLM